MIKSEYYDFITKKIAFPKNYMRNFFFRYHLARLIQAVATCFAQQKYDIKWKSAFVRQKNRYYLKVNQEKILFWYVFVGKNFLLYFINEITTYAASRCIKM